MKVFLKAILGGMLGLVVGLAMLFLFFWLAIEIDTLFGLNNKSFLLSLISWIILPLFLGVSAFCLAHENSKFLRIFEIFSIILIIAGTLLGGYFGYFEGVESARYMKSSSRWIFQVAVSVLVWSVVPFLLLTSTWLGVVISQKK